MLEDKFVPYLDALALFFSLLGVVIVLTGGVLAFAAYIRIELKKAKKEDYNIVRQQFGRQILLSLEFFVGADLIKTIATPDFIQIGELAAIVGIRVVFSYFLNKEIEE